MAEQEVERSIQGTDTDVGDTATGDTDLSDADLSDAAPAPAPAPARPPIRARLRRLVRLPRSRRGILALFLILGGLGGAAMLGGLSVLHWTETADFCGRCHTMSPELAAHAAGPHREVACAECHVSPGIVGWVKAKINGTRQIIEMTLGTFPKPIPPPDHADLPPPEDTCVRCHSVERTALAQLKTTTQYTEDEANTRQFVGLMIRPGGGDLFDVDRSVHWHVLQDVRYRTADEDSASIDYVKVTRDDGSVREYIAQDQIKVAQDVGPDLERVRTTDAERRMSCYDCHNRVGHPISNPRQGVDRALSQGSIDASLPYIKRESMRILWGDYADEGSADDAIDGLRHFYELRYPAVFKSKARAVNRAIDEVKLLYRLTATPEMKVTARTYPDNMGHLDFPGCFRCHDGGHFLVRDGAVTTEVIPATCDTCHTYPQLGPAVASLPLGVPPDTHKDALYVFNHRNIATQVDPGGTSCGECHAKDYCVNCHSTGAVEVPHDEMQLNHAAVIRRTGNQACAYCHQPVYCARCHSEPVLPGSQPFLDGQARGQVPDVNWPLRAAARRDTSTFSQ